jgi:hypothetical protein
MQINPLKPCAWSVLSLCGLLLAPSNALFAQATDQNQDTPHAQSVPHQPRSINTQSPDQAQSSSATSTATVMQLCTPKVSDNIIVATAAQRKKAGDIALPPLTDEANGFAWPDTELGIVKSGDGYAFFGSDGAFHARQDWEGLEEGNNKYGSITRTLGTLDNPLGAEPPIDVTIRPNPDPAVNPFYSSYDYMGGGRFCECLKACPAQANCSWSITLKFPQSQPIASTLCLPSHPQPMRA